MIIKPLQSITPDGFNYQTLLLRRHHSLNSFSTAHVFPGGNLDPDDQHPDHSILTLNSTPQLLKPLNPPSEIQTSLKICAIRETFEESGLLIGLGPTSNHLNSKILPNFRQKLRDQQVKFSTILSYIQAHRTGLENHPEYSFRLDQLHHFANILTPTVLSKRWDTHFYLAILPQPPQIDHGHHPITEQTLGGEPLAGTLYRATPDGTEVTSTVWLTPDEAVKRCIEPTSDHPGDGLTLPPPQFYLLNDLASCPDYREIAESKRRMIPPFTPELVRLSTHGAVSYALTFPGDPLHSTFERLSQEETLDPQSFKHRIHIQNEPPGTSGLPAGSFFRPLGLERVGVHKFFGHGWEDLVPKCHTSLSRTTTSETFSTKKVRPSKV